MSFNRKDLQGDDDDFKFEDDTPDFGNGDDFKFEDEPTDVALDDDRGFGFEGEDMPSLDDDSGSGERQGASRTFVFLAAVMIFLFVIGLVAVLYLATQSRGPTDIDLTRTAIVAANSTTEALLSLTQTAAPLIALQQTQTASVPTATNTPLPTDTPTPTTSPTAAPTADATQTAQALMLSAQEALALTQTAEAAAAAAVTPTTGIGASDVALTATALAELLAPQGTPVEGAPTQEVLTPAGPGTVPTALPQTGFFDDMASGNMGAMVLLMFGLIGLIIISRVGRMVNR